jgi:hypothetical protein
MQIDQSVFGHGRERNVTSQVLLDAFPRERVGGPSVADEVLVQAQGMPQQQASVERRVRASEIPGRAYVGRVLRVISHRRGYQGRGDAAGQRRILGTPLVRAAVEGIALSGEA